MLKNIILQKFLSKWITITNTANVLETFSKLLYPSRKCLRCFGGKASSKLPEGPPLEHFLTNSPQADNITQLPEQPASKIPFIVGENKLGCGRKVFFETYGCQMNVNDTEIAKAVLKNAQFEEAQNVKEADVLLVMTCAIREGAEQKIWNRLSFLKSIKQRRKKSSPLMIGVLGCMAERLKTKIIETEKMVDIVCGPDAYRDLPRMLAETEPGQSSVNVLLSLDETYADIMPVRLCKTSPSAFVSIMRGCDNMCTYCIVPFTRGRERSRPMSSIIEEIRTLSSQGLKEVTLLGQNVNSYRDLSEFKSYGGVPKNAEHGIPSLSKGFSTIYKTKHGGNRFSDLLDKVSEIDPEMRIRFTSPHPKDFPDEVLQLIKERTNICTQIHLPAQSGNNAVLETMMRGYTRKSYLELVEHIRDILPDVCLTSDFIAGFCGETEEAHNETLDLIQKVGYNFVYCFPYSMREKTRANRRLVDDVPKDVKLRRHMEISDTFRNVAIKANSQQIGEQQVVLVEGVSKRSSNEMAGRNDGNIKIIVPNIELPDLHNNPARPMTVGDYVVVQIQSAGSQVLKGIPLYHTTLQTGVSRSARDVAVKASICY